MKNVVAFGGLPLQEEYFFGRYHFSTMSRLEETRCDISF
jgi:hypothetical protein